MELHLNLVSKSAKYAQFIVQTLLLCSIWLLSSCLKMAPEAGQFSSNISDVGIQKYLWETRNVFLVLLSTFKHFEARFEQFIGSIWKITYFVTFLCPSSKSGKSLDFFEILKILSEMDYESLEPSNLTWMQCYDQKWLLRISQKFDEILKIA